MRRSVPAAVEKIQGLLRIGEGHNERMISPNALVRDIHAFLAFAQRFNDGSIGVDPCRLFCERLGLLSPNRQPCLVDRLHQVFDVSFIESSAKVACGRWVRNALRAECVQKDFVVPSNLDVFESLATAQDVVSDIEHVVGLMVRPVLLEHFHSLVDRIHEPCVLCHSISKADSSVANRSVPFGEFVANIFCLEHRTFAVLLKRPIETTMNISFARGELLSTFVAFSGFTFLLFLISLALALTILYLLFAILLLHSKSLSVYYRVQTDNFFYPYKQWLFEFYSFFFI